jgi:hypothetical protein
LLVSFAKVIFVGFALAGGGAVGATSAPSGPSGDLSPASM